MTMTIDEKLEELRKELARQDAELEAAMKALADAPSNVSITFPPELLRELEDACTPRVTRAAAPIVIGIRA
jgi:hypothetical protein